MKTQEQVSAAIDEAMAEQRPFWGMVMVFGQRQWIAFGGTVQSI